jgi:hypothetical protein
LLGVCAVSAALIAARAWVGPYGLVNSPLNAESAFALAALLGAACAAWWGSLDDKRGDRSLAVAARKAIAVRKTVVRRETMVAVGIAAVVAATFWQTLGMPLLYDDYSHVDKISRAGADFWKQQIVHPGSGFFRPLGMYMYRLDSFWSGRNPWLWRLDNVALHAVNSALLFVLGRRLGLTAWTAGFAALLFAWHGSRPESAGWVAARFDLLAAMFVFGGLLLLFRYRDRPRTGVLAAALAMCVCGLLSKEEAFVFPLLATALLWRQISWRALAAFYGVTAAVFLYRWRVLGGIGGYLTSSGEPTIFILSASRTAKAFLMRLWAVLWFPIDWAVAPGVALALSMALMLAAWLWLAHKRAAMHWPALAFTVLAALPVQHLLLIGTDLEKSRVLYLPAAGFALLAAFAIQSVSQHKMAAGAAAAILIFQLTALEHNLAIWKNVSAVGRGACQQVGAVIQQTGLDATVTGLPNVKNGVYFLRNGFPECVEWNTGISQWRVHVVDRVEDAAGDGVVLRWDGSRNGFVRVR